MIKQLLRFLDYIHIQQLTHYLPDNLRGLKTLDLVREVMEELNSRTSLFKSEPWAYQTMSNLDIVFQKTILFNYIPQFALLERTYHKNNPILNLEEHFKNTINNCALRNFLYSHHKITVKQLNLPSSWLDKKLSTYGYVKKSIVFNIDELNSIKASFNRIPILIASQHVLFEQSPWIQDQLQFISQEIERLIHL